jgi:hypothetical protein
MMNPASSKALVHVVNVKMLSFEKSGLRVPITEEGIVAA